MNKYECFIIKKGIIDCQIKAISDEEAKNKFFKKTKTINFR